MVRGWWRWRSEGANPSEGVYSGEGARLRPSGDVRGWEPSPTASTGRCGVTSAWTAVVGGSGTWQGERRAAVVTRRLADGCAVSQDIRAMSLAVGEGIDPDEEVQK